MAMKKLIVSILCVLLSASLLCSCGSKTQEKKVYKDTDEHVNLVWYVTAAEPAGIKEVMEKVNEYLGEKLNVTLDLRVIESGDYETKMQLALASGEPVDLIWTSNWKFNYESNVLKNAFLPLDDYLDSPELSDLKNYYHESIWDAAKVSGKIYGVPMEQVMYNQKGIHFTDKTYLDKYGYTNYYDQVHDMDELTDMLQTITDGEANDPTFYAVSTKQSDFFIPEMTTVSSGWEISPEGEVTDRKSEYDIWRRQMYDWNKRGFFPASVTSGGDGADLNVLTTYCRYLPGVEGKSELSDKKHREHIVVPSTEPFMGRNGIQSTLTAVAANSKNPVRALKLLYLTHTDEYLLNLLCYGIEGRDFTKDPENPKRMNREQGGYYLAEFLIGSQFLAYLAPSYEDGVWEETKKANEEAYVDPNIGFCFDPSSVESDISQVSAVKQEFSDIFAYGLSDPEITIPAYYEKLELAGFNQIGDEIKAQYSEWKNQNQ